MINLLNKQWILKLIKIFCTKLFQQKIIYLKILHTLEYLMLKNDVNIKETLSQVYPHFCKINLTLQDSHNVIVSMIVSFSTQIVDTEEMHNRLINTIEKTKASVDKFKSRRK